MQAKDFPKMRGHLSHGSVSATNPMFYLLVLLLIALKFVGATQHTDGAEVRAVRRGLSRKLKADQFSLGICFAI